MKILVTALVLGIMTSVSGCTKSSQGNSSTSIPITLSYATIESGQLELINSVTGYSYAKITTGSKTVGILGGSSVHAVWTPASGDSNTPQYWIDSRLNSTMAAGAARYDFKVVSAAKVQMHLLSAANSVRILAPAHGVTSWLLNGVSGQVSAGDPTASITVRASDSFTVNWNANSSAYYISVWDLAGASKTDRSRKESSSATLILSEDTTISAEITTRPPPHYRMKIQSPDFGLLTFTNPESTNLIVLPSNQTRFGKEYEVLTDNDPMTTAALSIAYDDYFSGYGAASFSYFGVTTPLTIAAAPTPNYDSSLNIVANWNMILKNDGADDLLSVGFSAPNLSCSSIWQIFVNQQCFNGVNYCATFGQLYNGVSCY